MTCSGGEIPATYGLALLQSAPSLDGKSTKLSIAADPSKFVDALYYIKTGAQSAATNFTYDLYFYLDNTAPVALEFTNRLSEVVAPSDRAAFDRAVRQLTERSAKLVVEIENGKS